MAAWFGHTQTITSISKSVTTVAGGIMGLEDNLATFMKKVIYYEKFFQRVGANLPIEIMEIASRLFARCYEYRDEIRDELESSLAYVADAGRWVIGMEDWNTKMEKRLLQINELVLVANTLLVEYAMTGRLGAEGSTDELDAYLQTIAKSIVLKNEKSTESGAKQSTGANAKGTYNNRRTTDERSGAVVKGDQHQINAMTVEHDSDGASHDSTIDPASMDTSSLEEDVPGVLNDEELNEVEDDCYDDDDSLNPFAESYQPPAAKYSLESSLASLRSEPDNGSLVQDVHVHTDDLCDVDEPDSPVSLSGYECLEMDSIPKYLAFKPSALAKKQHAKNTAAAIEGRIASEELSPTKYSTTDADNWSPTRSQRGDGPVSSSCSSLSSEAAPADPVEDGRRQRTNLVMDMNYSYDFQREVAWNPFVSPPAAERQLLPQVIENPHALDEDEEDQSVEYSGSQYGLDEDDDVDHQSVDHGDCLDGFENSDIQAIEPLHSRIIEDDRITPICQDGLPDEDVSQALESVITEIDGASHFPEFFDAEDGGDDDIQTLIEAMEVSEEIVVHEQNPTPPSRVPDSTTLMMIEPTD